MAMNLFASLPLLMTKSYILLIIPFNTRGVGGRGEIGDVTLRPGCQYDHFVYTTEQYQLLIGRYRSWM